MALALLFQLCFVKATDDVIAKKIDISSQNYRIFAWIVQTKLNYESIVDNGGPNLHSS